MFVSVREKERETDREEKHKQSKRGRERSILKYNFLRKEDACFNKRKERQTESKRGVLLVVNIMIVMWEQVTWKPSRESGHQV